MNIVAQRNRFLQDSVTTSSPVANLIALYDRLVLDCLRGEHALSGGDRAGANRHLQHAQDILTELRSALRPDLWSGAAGLDALYGYLRRELIAANVAGTPARVTAVRGQIETLQAAWKQAASQLGG